ncbi:MAG: DNA alkylation repair protein [Limisphaerales bacterium]
MALIPALRRKLLLKEAFATADILLQDEEDLVQKGYGWMLKEASNRYPKEVFKYVMKNRKKMPRTALRYAIEKMPKGWKKKAMRKDL